jgi:hypothetical protein
VSGESDTEISQGDSIRFNPPGLNHDRRIGTVDEIFDNELHDVILHVTDEYGTRYQFSYAAIVEVL